MSDSMMKLSIAIAAGRNLAIFIYDSDIFKELDEKWNTLIYMYGKYCQCLKKIMNYIV